MSEQKKPALENDMDKWQIPNNGANAKINVIASVVDGDEADQYHGNGGSESHERRTRHILLQTHLHAQNLQAGDQEIASNLARKESATRQPSAGKSC